MKKQKEKSVHVKPGLYTLFYCGLKEIAKAHGYNLIPHGSMNRDLDLIAIPWTDLRLNEQKMIKAFQMYLTGHTIITSDGNVSYTILPGNRHSYVIDLNRGNKKGEWSRYDEEYYLDISVIQYAAQEVAAIEMPTKEECEKWAEDTKELIGDDGLTSYELTERIIGRKEGCDFFRSRMEGEQKKEYIDKSISVDQYMRLNPDIETGGE